MNLNNIGNLMSMYQSFRQNPIQFFMQNGMNVPQGISNDPNQIIQHLMNNGRITQQQYNQAMQMARQLGKF